MSGGIAEIGKGVGMGPGVGPRYAAPEVVTTGVVSVGFFAL